MASKTHFYSEILCRTNRTAFQLTQLVCITAAKILLVYTAIPTVFKQLNGYIIN